MSFLIHGTPQVIRILSFIKVSYAIKPDQGITLLSIGFYRFAIQPEFSQTTTFGLMCIGGLLSMYGLLAMFYEGLTKKAY
ncbi:hypothetical protein PAT01_03480 [Pseudoalteromonas atlantica]|uniref:Uncharacterized protein n=1 Tax=Pseudoalteromonas atlantica TaxID=288 RepID=A0ABQ0U951_PSEAF|nr:hypothetical protein PAT01_03480 [Pseudoalteromonas atlantica]